MNKALLIVIGIMGLVIVALVVGKSEVRPLQPLQAVAAASPPTRPAPTPGSSTVTPGQNESVAADDPSPARQADKPPVITPFSLKSYQNALLAVDTWKRAHADLFGQNDKPIDQFWSDEPEMKALHAQYLSAVKSLIDQELAAVNAGSDASTGEAYQPELAEQLKRGLKDANAALMGKGSMTADAFLWEAESKRLQVRAQEFIRTAQRDARAD